MKNVTVKRTVAVALTAEQWQLYQKPGVEMVAERINRTVEVAFNQGLSRTDVWLAAQKTMTSKNCAALGAADTEPFHVLAALLDELFPGERQ